MSFSGERIVRQSGAGTSFDSAGHSDTDTGPRPFFLTHIIIPGATHPGTSRTAASDMEPKLAAHPGTAVEVHPAAGDEPKEFP
jgi:hypothetical protein